MIYLSTAQAATPKQMIDNVATLSEAGAGIQICFESSEYKKLSTEQALAFIGLDIRIEDLVSKIAAYYDDDALEMTYLMAKSRWSEQDALKEEIRTKYNYCGVGHLNEMTRSIPYTRKRISSLVSSIPL